MSLDNYAKALREKRAVLEGLSAGTSETRAAVELDQSKVGRLSRMDALQQYAMDSAVEKRRRIDIARINAALKRIDDEDYGYCFKCGEDIPSARLTIDPAATLCRACAT